MTSSQTQASTPGPEPAVDRPRPARRARRVPPNLVFLAKRAGTYLIVLAVSVVLNFVLPRLMPNDPAQSMIRDIYEKTGQRPSEYQMQIIHNMYGDPDRPIWEQFWNYLGQLARLDLGRSIMYYPMEVTDLIVQALPWTLYLGLISTLLGWIIGTYLGARLGWRPGRLLDSVLTPVAMFFSSIPPFWLGLLLVWYLSYSQGLFPAQGAVNQRVRPAELGNVDFVLSILYHSVLPLFALVVVGFTGWMFSMRNMMITTVNEDYVHLARAKGLRPERVRTAYAARNALLPNITGLAMSIGGVLMAVVLAESVFIYPGLGGLIGASTAVRDYPLMQALLLIVIVLSLVFNFIADSVYVLLDPRTREGS
ncbi:ABC transporter permease [Brachybacterium sp. J153]|uniref:ABC transporter permease n=1 Tax=Brachybacterium sp. J153 TaxID=3116488 RepID=UPI002E78C908|nr:ABC transporter permease [Brachybacterium sp. J153]MEE1618385.1 ABC transporter permease [Brachybacterium sp. J153]